MLSCDPELLGFGLVMLDAVLGDVAIAEVASMAELLDEDRATSVAV